MIQAKKATFQEDSSGDVDRELPVCRVCGQEVSQLFQQETCKPCLLDRFNGLIGMIDRYRSLLD